MITPGAPVAVVLGGAGRIAYPTMGQSSGAWSLARLTNASPYPLKLYLGGQYLETLGAWTANVYPLQAPTAPVSSSPTALTFSVLTPANAPAVGIGDSTLYPDFALFGDGFPGSYPQPLAGQAVAAAVAGAVTTSGEQVELTGSPFTFTGSPQTKQFTLPPGSPNLSGMFLVPELPVPGGQTPGTIKVVGADSGTTYLQTTPVSASPVICDFSSVEDPDGVNITFTAFSAGGSGFILGVIGLERSQIVRPIHGGLAEAATDVSSFDRSSASPNAFTGFGSAQAIRIWGGHVTLQPGASSNAIAQIIAGGHVLASATTGTSCPFSIEGGLVITGVNVTPPTVNNFGTTTAAYTASIYWNREA